VTFFGPDGSKAVSTPVVKKAFQNGASQFGPNGKSRLKLLQHCEGGDIAYWMTRSTCWAR